MKSAYVFGVPQGIVLGFILFLISVCDIISTITKVYSDDTVIFYSSESWPQAFTNTEEEFKKIKMCWTLISYHKISVK